MKSTGTCAALCLGGSSWAASVDARSADTVVGKYNGAGGCAAVAVTEAFSPKLSLVFRKMNTASGPDRINTLAPIRFFPILCPSASAKSSSLKLPPTRLLAA